MIKTLISVAINEIERLKFKKNHGNDTARQIPWIQVRVCEFECYFDENDREKLYY